MSIANVFEGDIQAPNLVGNTQGTHTGPVIGPVSGNTTGTHTGGVQGNVNGGVVQSLSNLAGDGAIAIPASSATFYITKGSAAALTIAAPTAGTDDGKQLTIYSETAFAHVLTCASDGFNAKGSSGTVTWANVAGNAVVLEARNGHWWVIVKTGTTVA